MCEWNGNRLVKNPTSRMSFMHPFFGCTLTENQSSISHRLSCSLKCSVLVGGQEYINSPYHYISSMSIRNIWPVFVCKRHREDRHSKTSVNAIIKEDMCFVGDRKKNTKSNPPVSGDAYYYLSLNWGSWTQSSASSSLATHSPLIRMGVINNCISHAALHVMRDVGIVWIRRVTLK